MRRVFRPGDENAVLVARAIVPVGRIAAYLAHAAVAVVQCAERYIVHVRLLRPETCFPSGFICALYATLRAITFSVAVGRELLVAPAAFNGADWLIVAAFIAAVNCVCTIVYERLATCSALVLVFDVYSLFARLLMFIRFSAFIRTVAMLLEHLLELFAAALALRVWMVVCLAAA